MKKFLLLIAFCSLFIVQRDTNAADVMGSQETIDVQGTTTHFNGTVGTTTVAIPAAPGTIITEVLYKCPARQTPTSKACFISFDGGTNFLQLFQGEFVGWSAKGELRQVHVKGSQAGVDYEMLLNRELW